VRGKRAATIERISVMWIVNLLLAWAVALSPAVAAQEHQPGRAAARANVDLVGALKATPGCIGVEVAQTASGKQVIFAWFENKKAVLNWFYDPVHQAAMQQFFPGGSSGRQPLADLPDDGQPIMAIASLTMAAAAPEGVTMLPVSQISIELYRPAPGGLSLGGRFSPAGLEMPSHIDIPMPAAASK
jgi:hypothetical protein